MENNWFINDPSGQEMLSTKPPTTSTPKIKSTCNSCAAAKVKCGREKPCCSRCQERGLKCHYDLSQRSGRRPTRALVNRTNTNTSKSFQEQAKRSIETAGSFQLTDDDFMLGSNSSGMVWDTFPLSAGSGTATPRLEDCIMDYPFDLSGDIAMPDDVDLAALSDSSNEQSYFPTSYVHTDVAAPAPMVAPQNAQHLSRRHTTPQAITSAGTHATMSTAPFSMPSETSFQATTPLTQDNNSSRLLQLLLSLETAPPPASPGELTPPPENGTVQGINHTVTRIIDRNGATLRCLEQILNCDTLVHDQQCLLIALIISRVLLWYKSVLTSKSPSTVGVASFADSQFCKNLQHELGMNAALTPSFDTMMMPNLRGANSYPLDTGSNQARMRAQLVLSELRHVLRALDSWSRRCHHVARSAETLSEASSNGRLSAGYGAILLLVENDLRTTLHNVTEEAKTGLN